MSCIQACMKAIFVEDTAKERGYQHFIFSDPRCLLELKDELHSACMKAIFVEDTAKERGYQHFIFSDSRCLLDLKVDELDLGLEAIRVEDTEKREVTSTSSFPIASKIRLV